MVALDRRLNLLTLRKKSSNAKGPALEGTCIAHGAQQKTTRAGVSVNLCGKQIHAAYRKASERFYTNLFLSPQDSRAALLLERIGEELSRQHTSTEVYAARHRKDCVGGLEAFLHAEYIATLKSFKNGGSQAIRLPASEAAGVAEWVVERLDDGRLILKPIREKKSGADLLRGLAALKVDLFPEGREAMEFPEREW